MNTAQANACLATPGLQDVVLCNNNIGLDGDSLLLPPGNTGSSIISANFSSNFLRESSLPLLATLQNLQTLKLENNPIEVRMGSPYINDLHALFHLPHLTRVEFGCAGIDPTVLSSCLSDCNFRCLILSNVDGGGVLSAMQAGLRVRILTLDNCRMSPHQLVSIIGVPQLAYLVLEDCEFTPVPENWPADIAQTTNPGLRKLDLIGSLNEVHAESLRAQLPNVNVSYQAV